MTVAITPISDRTDTPPPGIVLLRHISWEAYRVLGDEIGDDPVHLTYDNGLLEIEVPSERHEQIKVAMRTMVEDTLKAYRVRFEPLGSTTWNSRERLKGIEADECYYIQHESAVRGKRPIDLATCPPPDLAIEVEVAAAAIDKLEVYGALGIPEVWRVGGDGSLRILLRSDDGGYNVAARSAAVPQLPPELLTEMVRSLEPLGTRSFGDFVEAFQEALAALRKSGD